MTEKEPCGAPDDLPVLLLGEGAWETNEAKDPEVRQHIHVHRWTTRECSLLAWGRPT